MLLVYLGAEVSDFRDAGMTLRAQRAAWAAKLVAALREAAWAWQTHAYIVWPAAAALDDLCKALERVDGALFIIKSARLRRPHARPPPRSRAAGACSTRTPSARPAAAPTCPRA